MDARIYTSDDLIEIQIDSIKVWVSTLSVAEKQELMALMKAASVDDTKALDWMARSIKMTVKKIQGLKRKKEGKMVDFELEFEDEAKTRLTDKCVSSLMNVRENSKLSVVCTTMINGIPTGQWYDPTTGRPYSGIHLVDEESGELPLEQSPQENK